MDVDYKKYSDLQCNEYGDITITGNIGELDYNCKYIIKAEKTENSRGVSYKVSNIRRSEPKSTEEILVFLKGVLTHKQAETLFSVYPNIIQIIMEEKEHQIDFSKLNNITINNFKCIKEKIINNYVLAELVAEFDGFLSLTIIKKLYKRFASTNMVREKIKNDPYECLCSLGGVGFKVADKTILSLEKNKVIDFGYDILTSQQRCLSCIKYVLLESESNGHTKIEVSELNNKCKRLVPRAMNHFITCLQDESLYFKKSNNTVYISRKIIYDTEKSIAESIKTALTHNTVYKVDVEKYNNVGTFTLSNSQMSAIKNLCSNNICILNGYAGSGKSYTLTMLLEILDDLNKSYLLMAPTGKAAKVVASYTKRDAKTVHRGLGYRPHDGLWAYNHENKLSYDIVVVDEFSMVDIFIGKRIFDAIDFSRTKLLIIGDSAQLPSVQSGNLLNDFISSNTIPTTTLKKIFRYKEGGLMKVATDTRNQVAYLKDLKSDIVSFGDNKDYTFINCSDNDIVFNTVTLYKKLLEKYKPEEIYVLSSQRKHEQGTISLNKKLQKVANTFSNKDKIEITDRVFYVDDLVMQYKNNYKAELIKDNGDVENDTDINIKDYALIANGESGVIESISNKNAIINFEEIKTKYTKGDLFDVELGYATTIHKSQGSSNKVVILLTPRSHSFMLNSNLIYVGLTRTQQKCFHLGDADTVNRIVKDIKKKAHLNRDTWMVGLLK